VSLDIAEKEFVTFLGPSGCGKTTMLRTLAGFLTPDRGTVAVAGRLLSSPQGVVPPERRRMGMVFQNYAVWPHMTVLENVAFGLRIAKVDRQQMEERVTRVLVAVGLTGLEARHPGQLSGGQQQRVALARSLVVEPSILLLDEPLSNLDAKLRERMRVELKALQRRMGLTFVYVTHDQAEAMALSDRIVVFDRGAVQQIGAPREIYERPANLFVADFMGLVNRLPAILIEQAQGTALVRVGPHELRATIGPDAAAGSGAVALVIRPEAIRLGDGATGDNRLASRMPLSSVTSSTIKWTLAAACCASRAIDRPHSSPVRGSLSPCPLRSAPSCAIRVEAMRETSVDARPPGGRSIGRRKRKTS
jgi:iron(III) transport system ATP-binding protein